MIAEAQLAVPDCMGKLCFRQKPQLHMLDYARLDCSTDTEAESDDFEVGTNGLKLGKVGGRGCPGVPDV
jgi:hypothetical protein